jgi:hypothetical protein
MNENPIEKQEPTLRWRIVGARILEYFGNDKEVLEAANYRFDISIETGADDQGGLILVGLIIKMSLLEKPEEIIASLNVQFTFQIENIAQFIEERVLRLSDQVWLTFFSIALGGARGIFLVKNESFSFGNVVMPPIDSTPFIPKPIVFGDPEKQMRFTVRV